MPKFQIYKAADGWRFRLIAANGEPIAAGTEAYDSPAAAERGVQAVQRAVAVAKVVRKR